MYDAADDCEHVTVTPPLSRAEAAVVGGLAGVGDGPRRLWPRQPGHRSPWLPCLEGCCLAVESQPHRDAGGDPATWLRFLIRELLAPRSGPALARARSIGLAGGHRLQGRVLLDLDRSRPRLVVVSGNRVREMVLDEDLFPLERPPRRTPGEVVPLDGVSRRRGRRGQRADR